MVERYRQEKMKNELGGRLKEVMEINLSLMWMRIASVFGPKSERSGAERENFWKLLRECIWRFREKERLIVMVDQHVGLWTMPEIDWNIHSSLNK